MSLMFWKQVSKVVSQLSPEAVERESETPFALAVAGSAREVSDIEDWLIPPQLNPQQQARSRRLLFAMKLPLTAGDRAVLQKVDARIAGVSAAYPASAEISSITRDFVVFDSALPQRTAKQLISRHSELALSMARHFPPLREPVADELVHRVAKENAAFALLSAIPNVIPSPIELPWAIGEFASDTVVITANQMRMALAIAAAFDSPVGFLEQRGQILSIMGSAFGLRALARELAGKIPAGGGLVMKGLIAYAGTYTMGLALAHWHRSGRRLTSAEKRKAYQDALSSGRARIEQMARMALGTSVRDERANDLPSVAS